MGLSGFGVWCKISHFRLPLVETQEYIKSELNNVADPASRNKLQTMRKNAKSHGWKIEAELNRIALVQLIPDFEILLTRLIALTDAMHDPARSQDKFN